MSEPLVVKVPEGYDVVYDGRVYPFTYENTANSVADKIRTIPNFNLNVFASWEIGGEPKGAYIHG